MFQTRLGTTILRLKITAALLSVLGVEIESGIGKTPAFIEEQDPEEF
jgi:hypothetical protein